MLSMGQQGSRHQRVPRQQHNYVNDMQFGGHTLNHQYSGGYAPHQPQQNSPWYAAPQHNGQQYGQPDYDEANHSPEVVSDDTLVNNVGAYYDYNSGLHPLLQEDRTRPRYDTRKAPDVAIPEFETSYEEPAVVPEGGGGPRMIRIIFEDPSDMPWTIDIRTKGRRSVTMFELWTGLYNGLHERITPSEWALFHTRVPNSLFQAREREWKRVSSERRRASGTKDRTLLRLDWLQCCRGVHFVGLKRDDVLADRLLMPGMERCEHTYVAKFSSSETAAKTK